MYTSYRSLENFSLYIFGKVFLEPHLNISADYFTNGLLLSASILDQDAGQPEVVLRGSPWYETKSFSSLVLNILIM